MNETHGTYGTNATYGTNGIYGSSGRVYNPRLGVENLPLAEWSGLHIASPIARIAGQGGEGGKERGVSEGGRDEVLDVKREEMGDVGIALGGDEEGKGRGERVVYGGSDGGVRRGGYWGDYPESRGK
jgi:hypothetical protein